MVGSGKVGITLVCFVEEGAVLAAAHCGVGTLAHNIPRWGHYLVGTGLSNPCLEMLPRTWCMQEVPNPSMASITQHERLVLGSFAGLKTCHRVFLFPLSQLKPMNVEYLMMDASILLPPTGTPLTGIDFVKRLPCGDVERTRRVSGRLFSGRLHTFWCMLFWWEAAYLCGQEGWEILVWQRQGCMCPAA